MLKMYKFTKFDIVNMKIAFTVSELSYCQRRKVGAVIVKDNRIIANGYNGTITGTDNSCEDKVIVCKHCGKEHTYKDTLPRTRKIPTIAPAIGDVDIKKLIGYIKSKDEVIEVESLESEYYYTCECGISHKYALDKIDDFLELRTNKFVIHAEQNAIIFAARHGISVDGATMYVTTSPCPDCAKLIIASGIKKVIWKDVYKDTSGIDLLIATDTEVIRYDLVD